MLTLSLYVTLGLVLLFAIRRWSRKTLVQQQPPRSLTPVSHEKTAGTQSANVRRPGEWIPVQFSYPCISACQTGLNDIKPLPYRPFRWGKYNVTMGIRSMQWDEWIEVDNELPKYHLIRSERIRTRGDKVVKTLPPRPGVAGASSAAVELVYELSEFLVRKYPQIYAVTRRKSQTDDFGWYGDGQIESITILPLHITYELGKEDPLKVAALLTQDDLALMIEGSDGRYYFQAGAITVPGFWRMEDKIGLPLEEIHLTGDVPRYREKLQNSMERFFFKLSVDKPVTRNNYSVQIVRDASDPQRIASSDPDELAWSNTINGHEDYYYEQKGRGRPLDAQQAGKVEYKPTPTGSAENARLRTERQSLRRLPRSGAIVFTIRTYVFPITDLAKEPGVPGRMASAIRSWPDDVSIYKGKRLYDDAILHYLDESHRKQLEAGVVRADDQSSNYPY